MTTFDARRLLVAAALATVLGLSGCASVAVHTTVDGDGSIAEYRVQIDTSSTVYGVLNEGAKQDGYESLEESFLADVNESRAERVEYNESFDGDDVTITVTAYGFEPGEDTNISIVERDGALVFRDHTFANESAALGDGAAVDGAESAMAGFAVHYYLEMPGEITASNADEVDGNRAEWHETGMDAFVNNPIHAESELPTEGPIPGFGVGAALAALLAAGVVAFRTRG